jgi:hypothetical protein
MNIRALAFLLAGVVAVLSCRSPEQKLADKRRELQERVDELYAKYRDRSAEPAEGAPSGLVGRVFAEAGRANLEQHCLAVGRGERPFALSAKVDAFVQENTRECRKLADLQLEIDALAREVGVR